MQTDRWVDGWMDCCVATIVALQCILYCDGIGWDMGWGTCCSITTQLPLTPTVDRFADGSYSGKPSSVSSEDPSEQQCWGWRRLVTPLLGASAAVLALSVLVMISIHAFSS